MFKMTANVRNFAEGNGLMPLFAQFSDYWNHYRSQNSKKQYDFAQVDAEGRPITFEEKERRMHESLVKAVIERSGVKYAADSAVATWFNHPNVIFETFAIVSQMIDMILPQTVIDSIGAYAAVKTGGFGDSFAFDIKPRDIFVVSKAGHGQRTAELHKQFNGQVTVLPEARMVTVGVSLYRILAGQESLAEFTAKAVRGMETQISLDAYNAFAAAMDAVSNTTTTGLRVAGYTAETLVRLCQQVEAWSNGAKPIVMGTALALLNVLPTDANYRYDLESDYVKIGYVPTMHGYDLMRLPQVADISTPFGRVLADNRLWIVAPSSDKIVKVCLEGNTLSNTTSTFENADLSQTTTLWKMWGVGVSTNAVAGVITL